MYVDAIYDRDNDKIKVIERNNGEREYTEYPAEYVLYYEDPRGTYKTMWGDPCIKFSTNDRKKFQKELSLRYDRKIHESDINPIFRCLANNYLGSNTPKLNINFFDIETDFDPSKGFASPWDPFSRITAISSYKTSNDTLYTFVLKPDVPTTDKYFLNWDAAEEIVNKFDNCILCNDEEELLDLFLNLIEDDDVLSGWNSTGYDIPYLTNRIERVLGKETTKRLCLWGKKPKKRDYIKYKKKQSTYDLIGRVHLDYLDLYTKHNQQQLHSYRLDFVGEIEIGENKVPYEGTLDMLYKQDFEKFIAYNRQDTLLLYKIDKKRKFIELANQLAHTNTVLLPTTMGSVALIEQAIVNETHERGMVVSNKKHTKHGLQEIDRFDDEDEIVNLDEEEDGPAVGAYVADPKVGLHSHVACCDISSLYPSTLRALNMGPETLVGQIQCTYTDSLIAERIKSGIKPQDAWQDIFAVIEFDMVQEKSSDVLRIDFSDGNSADFSGSDLYDFIYEQGNSYCLSANGTIFRTDVEAIIPGLLKKWYQQRKIMQSDAAQYKKLAKDELDPIKKKEYLDFEEFWDQRQLARKINLNALYGSLLNSHMRFYDQRIGQSVTLTGRCIARHMNSKINELITGDYNHKGEGLVYADTDSSYFTLSNVLSQDEETKHLLDDRDTMIALYDNIADETNDSFAGFMDKTFNTGLERGSIIKAGRELVGSRGLFITKKRYAILMYDKEGTRLDVEGKPGKIKAMGLDLKRSDTPKMMQTFLEQILLHLLTGESQESIFEEIKEFRKKFRELSGWLKGTPKRVNSLSEYANRAAGGGRALDLKAIKGKTDKKINNMVPGHVQAALNWNKLREVNKDLYSMEMQDGQKVIVCKLKPNQFKMDSIAYPIDEPHIPSWFKELPFDDVAMEETIVDQKIGNLLGVLNWDLRNTREDTTFNDLFNFGG